MGHVKRKVSKHAQNEWIHIILHMRKISSGHLLSTETLPGEDHIIVRHFQYAEILLFICVGEECIRGVRPWQTVHLDVKLIKIR